MAFIPKPQEIYKHFKGNMYQIVTVAEHSETGEQMVVYQALYGDYRIYVRDLSMFTGLVDKEKYPAAQQKFRFELQGPNSFRQMSASVSEAAESEQVQVAGDAVAAENVELDPLLLEFLEADTYTKRLQILGALHHRITDDMITTMAIACDIEVAQTDLQTRYESLKSCLTVLEHYECKRLR